MTTTYNLFDIVEHNIIHDIFKDIYDFTKTSTTLVDSNFDVIFSIGSHDLCNKYHYAHEKTRTYCLKTREEILSLTTKDVIIYKCYHKISRILAPIVIQDRIFGFIVIGKFFLVDEEIDYDYYEHISKICNFPREQYLDTIRSIPIYDREHINKISLLYLKVVRTISELAHNNLEKMRLIREKEFLIESINKSKQNYLELYKEMHALLDISKSVFERFNYKYTSEVIFAVCKEIIGNDMAFFALLDDDFKRHIIVNIDTGSQSCSVNSEVIEIHGLIDHAYKMRNIIVDNNFKNNPRYKKLPVGHPSIYNLLISPMIIGSIPFGMLALANKKGGFTERDISLMSNIANIAGYATFNIMKYEEALINEAKYKRLVDSAHDAIFTINSKRKIILWNKGAERIFGYTEDEALMRDVSIIIPERFREGFTRHFESVISSGGLKNEAYRAEVIGLTKDQKEITIELCMTTINIKNEIYFTYIQRDISDKKAIEHELKIEKESAEIANKAKSEFISTVSHELRTPLNVILGFIDVINETPLDEKQRYYFDCIKLSSRLLLNLINDILDISKMEKGKLELNYATFDIYSFFDNIFQIFKVMAIKKGLKLSYKIQPHIPRFLLGDEGRLRQIMINLLGNAIKFTDSGYVSFEVSKDDIYINDEKIRLIVLVKDSGIGIPNDKIEHIFEDFVQLKMSGNYQGTGLGLPICKRLLKMMNGDIWVETVVGKGSSFYFTVELGIGDRVTLDGQEHKMSEQDIDLSQFVNKKVLLVEDNALNQFVIKQILTNKGIDVTIANHGQEAVNILTQEDFDIVLMDIQMPIMDGITATKIIRDKSSDVRNHNIPIIAFTAHALAHEKEHYINLGMNDYIPKPVDSKLLLYKIQMLI